VDGFRGIADTINRRMLSKRGNRMKRFEGLLATLPAGSIFEGEIIAPDGAGRPIFADLMLGRGAPAYVAFDVLAAEGEDLRSLLLARRKGILKRLVKGARNWIAVTNGMTGDGRRLFEMVAAMDLEGIVGKRLADPYGPGTTTSVRSPRSGCVQNSTRLRTSGSICAKAISQIAYSPTTTP
jgi:bifunctional non-homologous end joining protein LigD